MIKEIQLTKGYFALVDNDKYEYLMQWKWRASLNKTNIYAVTGSYGNKRYMHNVLLPCEVGFKIDHIDRNGLNNKLSNLRIATNSQNSSNRVVNNPYGYKGIVKRQWGRWSSKITKDYKQIYIGTFDTAEEAAKAYDVKAMELFGEFAVLNFPEAVYA